MRCGQPVLDGSRVCLSCSAPLGALRIAMERPRVIPDTRRQKILAALAVVLVVTAAAGIAVLAVIQNQPVRESGTSEMSQAAAQNPHAEGWSRIPHDEEVLGGTDWQEMNSAAANGAGYVAVGQDSSGGDEDAAVWTSPDGITWTRILHREPVLGGDRNQSMLAVTGGGPGLVAVGHDSSSGDEDAAVWTSPDGVTWTRISQDEDVLGGNGHQVMLTVTVGGPGLIAAGYEHLGSSREAAVWTSVDGVTWTRIPYSQEAFGGNGHQVILTMAAGGPGFVAVGSSDGDAAVWTSSDGFSWDRVPADETVFGGSSAQEMRGVVAGDPGLVVVGFDRGDAAVWVFSPG